MSYVGIVLALLTSLIFGVSVTLQKHSLRNIELFTIKGILSHRMWLLALLIGFSGVGVYILAMNYAPLSTVQPILAMSMIIPIISGVIFFNERQEVHKWLFVILVIAGIALVSLF